MPWNFMSLLLSKVTPPVIRSSRSCAMLPRRWSLLAFSVSSGESRSSGCEMSVLRSSIGASVDVLLVAVLGGEVQQIILRFLPRQIALPPDHLDQRFMDVVRHRLLIAAHIEVRAFLEPGIQIASLFEHAVLHVDLVSAVTRKGHVEAAQYAVLQPLLPFHLIEEVAAEIALAKEQPRAARGSANLPLLKEGAERGDARAGADHDDRNVVVGKTEVRVLLDVDRDHVAHLEPIGDLRRCNSAA